MRKKHKKCSGCLERKRQHLQGSPGEAWLTCRLRKVPFSQASSSAATCCWFPMVPRSAPDPHTPPCSTNYCLTKMVLPLSRRHTLPLFFILSQVHGACLDLSEKRTLRVWITQGPKTLNHGVWESSLPLCHVFLCRRKNRHYLSTPGRSLHPSCNLIALRSFSHSISLLAWWPQRPRFHCPAYFATEISTRFAYQVALKLFLLEGMIAHTCNSNTLRWLRQEDGCQFKTSSALQSTCRSRWEPEFDSQHLHCYL